MIMASKLFQLTKRLPILVILMCICTNMYAQLYDSEDEVRIYVNDEALISGEGPQYVVFNLNGKKGALLEISVPGYFRGADPATVRSRDKLLEDEHYFEKLIFGDEVLIVN